MADDRALPGAESVSGRRFKFDRGDWVAVRSYKGDWRLAGKVVDADSESCTIENASGVRSHYVPGEDAIARVRWTGRDKWEIA
jgi:hypothetical protein